MDVDGNRLPAQSPQAARRDLHARQRAFYLGWETGNHPGVYRFGSGYDPHKFIDLRTGASVAGNYVLYVQGDQAVYRMGSVGAGSKRGLDLTYSEDYAPGNVTQYSHQICAGARWIGLSGGRWKNDMVGLGYVRTAIGSHFREASVATGKPPLSAENLVEANYLANVTPWLLVQPVVQWFAKPAGDAARGAVFVSGFRTKVTS